MSKYAFPLCFACSRFTCFAENLEKCPTNLATLKGRFARSLPRPYLGGCSLFERTCQYGYRSKGQGVVSEARRMGKGVPDNRRVDWRIYEDYRLKTVEDV